jgi:membrane protease YdiL (CAAX protease family)
LDGFGLFATLIVVALLPALFEELLFRGLLLNGLKKSFSDWAAAPICGGLFALFHQNPAQTPYQFCCGTVYALVAIKSGSILPMMLAHFLNNASIIIFYKFGIANFDKTTSIIVFCVSIAALIFSFVWLFVLDRQEKEREGKEGRKPFFLYASFGIIVSLFAWGLMLVNGL